MTPAFLARDRLDVLAQPVAVIQRHVGDQCRRRLNRIGRIQAPAHADFEYPDIEVGLGNTTSAASVPYSK